MGTGNLTQTLTTSNTETSVSVQPNLFQSSTQTPTEEYLFKIGNTNVVNFYTLDEITQNTNAQFLSIVIVGISSLYWFKLAGIDSTVINVGDAIRLYDNPTTENNGDYVIQQINPPDGVNFDHTQFVVDRPIPNGNFSSNLIYKIVRGENSNNKTFTGSSVRLVAQEINPGTTTTLTITGVDSGAVEEVTINVLSDPNSTSDPSDSQT